MPIFRRHDRYGWYYQYGQHGTRYYFNSARSERIAWNKCVKQTRAIHASQARAIAAAKKRRRVTARSRYVRRR